MDTYYKYRANTPMELIPLLPLPPPNIPSIEGPTFPKFSLLPKKVRRRIFQYAAPAPRTRFIEIYDYHTYDVPPRIRYIPPLPPLFRTCHESRRVSIKKSGGELIRFSGDPRTKKFFFDFERDIIFLSSRFTPKKNATETFKLREFTALMPLSTLSRIRRVVATYSSLDSYERIGQQFRYLAKLEVFYLAMTDRWSPESVKRRLIKGVPKPGIEANRIKIMVEDTEDRETSDEDEDEEEKKARLEARAVRRIVEVELRLDE